MWQRLKEWAARLKQELTALYLASRDPRTPVSVKCIALVVVAYALSPIDLIPDFIPVLGLLDDVILLPLGIALAVRLMPAALMDEFRSKAQSVTERPDVRWGVLLVAALWIAIAVVVVSLL